MEYITTHWNSLSESAKEIIILCSIVQFVVLGIMMNVLSALDRRRKWPTMDTEE